jgi:hypothetical protein
MLRPSLGGPMRRLVLLAAAALVAACPSPPKKQNAPVCADQPNALRPSSRPVETNLVRLELPTDGDGFAAFADKIFGDGERHHLTQLSGGYLLSVDGDDRTADQVIISVEMEPPGMSSDDRRLVTQVPASLAMGKIFIDTVNAAFAQTKKNLDAGDAMEDWELEYNVASAEGGSLKIAVDYTSARTALVFELGNPQTSLLPGKVNTAAFIGDPFETVGGTVWFGLSRDEFDFFSHRAYGVTAGSNQNFKDFLLHPHDWLRLTVTPQYALEVVDVDFEVLTVDGRRIPLAKAPASYVAGEQFQQNVERLADEMRAQEEAQPGSSVPWEAPFTYVDPDGGGSVVVRAQGKGGNLRIAYTVVSPASFLKDTGFVPYLGKVDLPKGPPEPEACDGDANGDVGRFVATFSASSTVSGSQDLKAPLVGNVWGSVFKSSDVTVLGPNDGAAAVADFFFENVDVRDPALLRSYEIATDLPFGDYQILGFMDIDHNADLNAPDPDTGDPVMIPIGGFNLHCGVQPVNVEFAITLPEGQ